MPPKKGFQRRQNQAGRGLSTSSKTKRDKTTGNNNTATTASGSPEKQRARRSFKSESSSHPTTPQQANNNATLQQIARNAKNELNEARVEVGLPEVKTGTAMKILVEGNAGEAMVIQPQCPIELGKCEVMITSGPKHREIHAVCNVNINWNKNQLWIQIGGTYNYLPSQFVIVLNEAGKTAQRQLKSDQDEDERFRHGDKRVYKRFIYLLKKSLRFVDPEKLGEVDVDDSYQEKKQRKLDLRRSDIPKYLSDGQYEQFHLGMMTDQEYEKVYKPKVNDFTAGRFYQWYDEFVEKNSTKPSRADLAIELVRFGTSNKHIPESNTILLDEERQEKESDLLYQKHCCVDNAGEYDRDNCIDLRHIFDNVTTGARMLGYCFDAMNGSEDSGPLFHVCNVTAAEAKILSKEEWTIYAQNTNATTGTGSLYAEAQRLGHSFWQQEHAAGRIGAPNLEAYLTKMDGKLCLLGNAFVGGSAGGEIQFSPHLTAPYDSHRVYVRTDAAQAMLAHRNKSDRHMWYGHGRQYGKRATLFTISRRYWIALQRVGLTNGNTMDIGSALFPIQVEGILETTWNGPGIANATFTPVQI